MPSNAGGIPASDASSLKSKFQEGRKKKKEAERYIQFYTQMGVRSSVLLRE